MGSGEWEIKLKQFSIFYFTFSIGISTLKIA